jgi:predicted Zn finger-like uncharacterized protein
MIIECASCNARYKFDENKLGSRQRARTKCPKCAAAIDIENPLMSALTLPPPPEPVDFDEPESVGDEPVTLPGAELPAPPVAGDEPATNPSGEAMPPKHDTGRTRMLENVLADGTRQETQGQDMFRAGALTLTPGKRYSLAVLQGAATGHIFPSTQPRITIGRQGADISLEDDEASRQHSAIEILGDHAILRDLGSTNGTFVDASRIEQHVLTNQMEFRIGGHVLMFIVTSVESLQPED